MPYTATTSVLQRSAGLLVAGLLAAGPLGADPALAAPPAGSLAEAWSACAASSHKPMTPLTDEDLAALAGGELIRRIERHPDGDYLLASIWVDVPREPLWIAVQDRDHFPLVDGLLQRALDPSIASERPQELYYQRMDAPWPVKDRQWVMAIWNDLDGPSDEVWTRRWTTADPAIADAPDPEAEWMPVNEGVWQLVEVHGGTFMIFSTRAVVGGVVPEEATLRWAMFTLGDLFEAVEIAAGEMPAHYDAAHRTVAVPGGEAIAGGSLAPCASVADCD